MVEKNDSDKEEAEVLSVAGSEENPDALLVEYPDDTVEGIPATPRNQALFGKGLFSEIDGTQAFDADGTPVELAADVAEGEYTLLVDGEPIPVPNDRIDDVIDAYTATFVGESLVDLYEDILDGQVRRHVVEKFFERFPDDRVYPTPDGWVVDDTFVVTYDATNHLVDVDPVDPYGNDVDESKQGVYLDIHADGERKMPTPNGESQTLTETEQEFLTMVEGLLYPQDYFGVDLVDEIEQHKAESEVLDDLFEDLASGADVTGFTDSKTHIHHGSTNHGYDKHRLSDLGVTDEVSDLLWAHDYDHAGVVELLMRKDELIGRPDISIFEDVPDSDPDKWDKIERTKENAPIPPEVQDVLDEMYK